MKQSRDGATALLTRRELPQEHQAQKCSTSSTQFVVWGFCEAYPYFVYQYFNKHIYKDKTTWKKSPCTLLEDLLW